MTLELKCNRSFMKEYNEQDEPSPVERPVGNEVG